jgi:hypothetical protein
VVTTVVGVLVIEVLVIALVRLGQAQEVGMGVVAVVVIVVKTVLVAVLVVQMVGTQQTTKLSNLLPHLHHTKDKDQESMNTIITVSISPSMRPLPLDGKTSVHCSLSSNTPCSHSFNTFYDINLSMYTF